MVPLQPGPDEGLARILRALPRREPPDVTVEQVLERAEARRRRTLVAAGAVAVLIGLAATLFSRPERPKPPVHLPLEIVDVPSTSWERPESLGPLTPPEEIRAP